MRPAVILAIAIVAVVGYAPAANAQRRGQFDQFNNSQVTPSLDRSVYLAMMDAQRQLKQNQYGAAVIRLQSILDHSEDFFLVKDFKPPKPPEELTKANDALAAAKMELAANPDDEGLKKKVADAEAKVAAATATHKTVTDPRASSAPQRRAKADALRILAELPEAGRKAYELQVGTTARDHLKHALATNDLEELSLVASNYQMTAAGFEALQGLAAAAFDRDQPLEASLLCETMLGHPRAVGAVKEALILQFAYACYLSGQAERSVNALRELKGTDDSATWQIGGRVITPFRKPDDAAQWLKTQFGSPGVPLISVVRSWSIPRGGSTGNESATNTFPIGGGAWAVSVSKHTRFDTDDETNQKWIDEFDELTRQNEQTMREVNRLTQPTAVPLIVGDAVVYRTLNDVTAVNLRTGKLMWRSSFPDGMLAWLLQSPIARADSTPQPWPLTFRGYLRFKLFRDQATGSLSSDGQRVYAVEESDSLYSDFFIPRGRQQQGMPILAEPTNKLVAYDVAGGRVTWEIGGTNGTPPVELSGVYFLGPPLPYEGHLYCIVESKNEIRLLAIIPEANTARLEWSQPLISANRGISAITRRMAGSIPAIAEGLAVCLTADGAVVAFDLVQHQLRWGYEYQSSSRPPNLDFGEMLFEEEEGRWLDSGTILFKGRAIVTPRDSNELHCLNLVDGTLVWKKPREGGLYVACVDEDRVITIERTQVAAYSLVDGTPIWTEATQIPEPSGRGIRVGSQYLLPLSTGEIVTLDLATGRILARSHLSDRRIPGNLAVGAGTLVSRGLYDVDGFHSLPEIEQQIKTLLAANTEDPIGLALRGELRLQSGREDEGISDLRKSLKGQPLPRVRRILAETLLNRMRNDPSKLLASSDELEAMTDDPRQKIEFLRLYARSLSDNGDRVAAVASLLRLSATSQIPDEMMSINSEYFISLEQTVRSQLFSIFAAARPKEQLEIGQAFAREFDAAMAADDRKRRLTQFARLTIGHPSADSLLLRLAESTDGFPDARMQLRLLERLSQSENREIAGSAVAALAARYLAVDSPNEARPLIEQLERDFPTVVCRQGKTGSELKREWIERDDVRKSATAKPSWSEGVIDYERTEEGSASLAFPVDIVTCVGHEFQGWSFETEVIDTELVARDPALKEMWRLPLVNFSEDLRTQPCQIHICGRRLAFSSGMRFVVVESTEPDEAPQILFEQSLRPNSIVPFRPFAVQPERRLLPNGHRYQLPIDPRGIAGFVIGLSDEAICFQLNNRLYAADPETGRILWSRVGSTFAKSNGTLEKMLVLNTADNGAMLIRTLDGEIAQRHDGNRDEMPLWFRGTRRLSHRDIPTDQRMFEMRNFDGDHVIWQSQHPVGSIHTVVNDEELFILEPQGKLVIIELKTGNHRVVTELPFKRQSGSNGIGVQKFENRYLIIAGVSGKNANDRRVLPLDFGSSREFGPSSIPTLQVDGHVTAVDRTDGRVLWTVPISDTVFDPSQSPSLPVLVLASKYHERDAFNRIEPMSHVSLLILDKRTGKKVYETEESLTPIGRGIQFVPKIEEQKLTIDVSAWQLELKFPGAK